MKEISQVINAHYNYLRKMHSEEVAEEFLNDVCKLKSDINAGHPLTERQQQMIDHVKALWGN